MSKNKHFKVLITIMLLVVVVSCQEEPTLNLNKQFLEVEFTDGLNNEERSIVELANERMIESSNINNGQYGLDCLSADELNISQDLFNFIRINMAYMNHKIKNGEYLLENKRPKLTSEGESCLKSRPANMELTKVTATDGDNPNDTNGGGYRLEIFEKATDWYKVYEENGYTIWEYTNTTYAYETRYSWVDDPHIYHYSDNYYIYYAGDMTDKGGNTLPAPVPIVVLDESFKNTKAECVYNKIKSSGLMKDLLKEFVDSDIYDVVYKVVTTLTAQNGNQAYGKIFPENNKWTIKINSHYFDKNVPVFIAKTIMHETIHAAIYQKVASVGGLDNLDPNNFEQLFAYYNHYGTDYHHKYMA